MPQKETIVINWPWEIKGPIDGPAVMFDVLAASYNIIHLSQKARRLFAVTKASVLDALARYPDAVLIGETDDQALYERIREKFISSNSPVSVTDASVQGKDVVLITNNGTNTLAELIDRRADSVIVGHWVNISAVADYLLTSETYEKIHLVPSGGRELVFAHVEGKLMEDYICAQALRDLLLGKPRDFKDDFRQSRTSIAAQYPVPQKEDELALIFQKNTTNVIPLCFPLASGIIEVKAIVTMSIS